MALSKFMLLWSQHRLPSTELSSSCNAWRLFDSFFCVWRKASSFCLPGGEVRTHVPAFLGTGTQAWDWSPSIRCTAQTLIGGKPLEETGCGGSRRICWPAWLQSSCWWCGGGGGSQKQQGLQAPDSGVKMVLAVAVIAIGSYW